MRTFTDLEQRILNRIQKDIRITPDPLKNLAAEMNIKAGEFLAAVRQLKDEKIIRDISGIFNADRLGYRSGLIAFEIPVERVERAAEIINENPGVSHNYLREHKFNVWFTLAVGPSRTLENEVGKLAEECGAADYLILRNEKMLKIGLNLSIGDEADDSAEDNTHTSAPKKKGDATIITEEDKNSIRILQMDLPLTDNPYKILAEENNIDIDAGTVSRTGEEFKKFGIMRRYSAVLRHQKAGYASNAMTAWKTDNINFNDDTVKAFSSVQNISHLYIRTLYPGRWEYPLFAMIHAKSDDDLGRIIKDIEIKTGIKDYLILKTLKEFKKKRVKYFQ
ncbi:MAG: Lrp/AsnC family transcriptional regulator [Spirochaetes bacterium]|nr:Lrp/AsnC family transcriptional regulator [Spirochaetota bacterium]